MSNSTYDCPLCGGPMKFRVGKFGGFFGCRAFPSCKGTRKEDGTANGGERAPPRDQYGPRVSEAAKKEADAIFGAEPAPELDTVEAPPPEPLPDPEPGPAIDGELLPGRPAWLQLDEHQEAVVRVRKGVSVVAAGAGSGKSTVLLERIASLLSDGVSPEHICTLVYNTSAARDFKARLIDRLGADVAQRVAASTFHGWAFQILKQWDPRNPAYQKGRIIGTDDGPSGYMIAASVTKRLGFPGDVEPYLRASEQIREALIDLHAADAVEQIMKLRVSGHSMSVAERLLLFTKEYQAEKQVRNAIDFADMLYKVGLAIRKGTAERLTTRYRHVQVDEGQDINVARLLISQHLGKGAESLVVVGDLRQSCYGFTGARPDLFKGLLEQGATLMTLPVNRRSTPEIVAAGNRIADGRDWNLGGSCSAAPERASGEPIICWPEADTAVSESSMVAAEIQARIAAGLPLANEKGKSSYACLVRTNAQAASLEAALTTRGIPVRVLGTSGGVWTTTIGREFRAYLAAAEGRNNPDITKIANKPVRYLKGDAIREALQWSAQGNVTFIEALRAQARQKMQWRPERHGAWQFADDLEVLAGTEWTERCHAVAQFLRMDLLQRSQQDAASDVAGQVSKPDEDKEAMYMALAETAARLGSLDNIEAQIKKVKTEEDGPAVEISTMHKAKGQEYDTVFVVGVARDVLPHEKAADVEEEWRLLYVAITRARKTCIVSPGGEPSQFFTFLQENLSGPKKVRGGLGCENAQVRVRAPACAGKEAGAEVAARGSDASREREDEGQSPFQPSRHDAPCARAASLSERADVRCAAFKGNAAEDFCGASRASVVTEDATADEPCANGVALGRLPRTSGEGGEVDAQVEPRTHSTPSGHREVAARRVGVVADCTATQRVDGNRAAPQAPVEVAVQGGRAELVARAARIPAPPFEARLRELRAKIADALPAAEKAAREAPAGGSGPGARFVAVTQDDMEDLLEPLGFWEAPRTVSMKVGQRVYEGGLPGRNAYDLLIRVYSTIPPGEHEVRELGEDSIKVVALRWDMDGNETPLHKKLPYACRTKGWRATLLRKIEETLDIIVSREGVKP